MADEPVGEPAGIGHNRPSLALYLDELTEAVKPVLADLDALVGDQKPKVPATFANANQAKAAIELALMLADLIETVQLLTTDNRKPLGDAYKAIGVQRDSWIEAAEDFRLDVRAKIAAFMDTMPPGESLRTDYGSLASRRMSVGFEITDESQVENRYKSPDDDKITDVVKGLTDQVKTAQGLDAAIKTLNENCPGVRFFRRMTLTLTDGGKT